MEQPKPPSVPNAATYDKSTETWQLGSVATGALQIWHPSGICMLDAHFQDGALDGELRFKIIGAAAHYGTDHYAFSNGLIKQFGLPDGDDMGELRASYRRGVPTAASFHIFMGQPNEIEQLHATFDNGALVRLRWKPTGTAQSVFKYGGVEIVRANMKIPKPWPATIEVEVSKGKVVSRTFLDAAGKSMKADVAPPPVAEWGQKTTRKELDGYIESGRFAKELATFWKGAKKATFDKDARRAPKVFDRLPKAQQAAARAFDAICKKNFPALKRSSLSGYGFDCVKNDLPVATDAKYFGLSYTLDGDLQLLDLETGRVLEWVHDYEPFEDDHVFPSLDAYAFAIVRIELLFEKRIPAAALEATFKRLGFAWATMLAR